ncbi:protein FAR1-RELATED SEQUENCE 6-like [Bidens hawaiensis]|uniref:protein FAR1-RELATED SEQUENCE 6-like n=1 Tax=Bidens hawaiensis TaxID=980011 RepID=UPI00404A0B7B
MEDGSHMQGVGSSSANKDEGPVQKSIGGRGKRKDPLAIRCPWVLLLSYQKRTASWKITRLINEHKCLQSREIYACTAGFLSNHLVTDLQDDPKLKVKSIKERGQYGLLRDYIEELKRTNPNTTVKLELEECSDPTSETRQFKRIYICLGSLKKGFKAIGRDLLGLDGAFLKSAWPGQLLTAVALDPNNGYYPVAYAVVESETLNSWEWFLECLGDDLDINNRSKFTFMSDRQKGLIQAVDKLFPSAEHRFCVRHIEDNLRSLFKESF